MPLERLSPEDRSALTPLRASAWAAGQTVDQFRARYERLYRHPFGQATVTYGERTGEGKIAASLDVLDILLRTGNGGEAAAGLVCSVITDPDQRGRGYASRLLTRLFEEEPTKPFLLFSDIGPAFYERFGFRGTPAAVVETHAGEGGSGMEPLRGSGMIRFLQEQRNRALVTGGADAAALWPSESFVDWVLERYRQAAEVSGNPFPDDLFWGATHTREKHVLVAAPNYVLDRVEVLSRPLGCRACDGWSASLAQHWGVSVARRWEPVSGTMAGRKLEWPMLRWPGKPDIKLTDPQMLDWW